METSPAMLILMASALLANVPVWAASASEASPQRQSWWSNRLGKSEVVLPGYQPVQVEGTVVHLGAGRRLDWSHSYFPHSIQANGGRLVQDWRLVLLQEGGRIALRPDSVQVQQATPHHAVVEARGKLGSADLVVTTRIEYDGVATSTLRLMAREPLEVQGLELEVDLAAAPFSEAIGFAAPGIRRQKDRSDLLQLPYRGPFLNAVGIADGERALWWFADNAQGWIWNAPTVTEVTRSADIITLKQKIIGARWQIDGPMRIEFNFLVTPVRELGNDWRTKRVVRGGPNASERKLGGTFKLWWPEALAHDAFPYTDYPPVLPRPVTPEDRTAYPGRAPNAAFLSRDKAAYGVSWLPYFSAHALSRLDPALDTYAARWAIVPEKVFNEVVLPYKTIYGKPVLTHRAEGYTDYLLARFDRIIDELGIDGVYLDHGPPHDSAGRENGAWIDSNGVTQPSLDIMALRTFLKRLRTLFWEKGKPGYIFIHNSNREIIPAYTFAYAQFSGEQYRAGRVLEHKYLDAVSLAELRMRLAPAHSGVLTVWLPVEWTYHHGDNQWDGSESQRTTFRRYLSLALLHDVMVHPHGSHARTRAEIFAALDRFGIERARFVGYWSAVPGVRTNDPNVKVSAYVRDDDGALFCMAANVGKEDLRPKFTVDATQFGQPGQALIVVAEQPVRGRTNRRDNVRFGMDIPAGDFRWFSVSVPNPRQH